MPCFNGSVEAADQLENPEPIFVGLTSYLFAEVAIRQVFPDPDCPVSQGSRKLLSIQSLMTPSMNQLPVPSI